MILMAILQVYNREIHMVVLVPGSFQTFCGMGFGGDMVSFSTFWVGKKEMTSGGKAAAKPKQWRPLHFFLGEV